MQSKISTVFLQFLILFPNGFILTENGVIPGRRYVGTYKQRTSITTVQRTRNPALHPNTRTSPQDLLDLKLKITNAVRKLDHDLDQNNAAKNPKPSQHPSTESKPKPNPAMDPKEVEGQAKNPKPGQHPSAEPKPKQNPAKDPKEVEGPAKTPKYGSSERKASTKPKQTTTRDNVLKIVKETVTEVGKELASQIIEMIVEFVVDVVASAIRGGGSDVDNEMKLKEILQATGMETEQLTDEIVKDLMEALLDSNSITIDCTNLTDGTKFAVTDRTTVVILGTLLGIAVLIIAILLGLIFTIRKKLKTESGVSIRYQKVQSTEL